MLNRFLLFIALSWTGLILFLCLENAKNIPVFVFPYIDKVVHFGFHFVFTILWFLYFKHRFGFFSLVLLLRNVWLGSLFFGLAIELIQKYLTTTRNADLIDVGANATGASIAVALLFIWIRRKKIAAN